MAESERLTVSRLIQEKKHEYKGISDVNENEMTQKWRIAQPLTNKKLRTTFANFNCSSPENGVIDRFKNRLQGS